MNLPAVSAAPAGQPTSLSHLAGAGEVGAYLLAHDWAGSHLGHLAGWPAQLHDALRITLHSAIPHIVYWGEALHTFWNDAARHFFRGQHPDCLGMPLARVQPDVMDTLQPLLQQVFDTGRAVVCNDIQLLYRRDDYTEEIHEVFSYSPLLDTDGRVRGIIAPIFDTTTRVLSERRMALLADLAAATRGAHTRAQYHGALEACLRRHPQDMPLAALYAPAPDTAPAQLVLRVGVSPTDGVWPAALGQTTDGAARRGTAAVLAQVMLGGRPRFTLLQAGAAFPEAGPPVAGIWGRPCEQVVALPVPSPQPERRPCWLVVALNPFKRLDSDYRTFLTLVAAQISQGLTDTHAIEQAADRALAEISSLMRLTTLGELATSIAHEINQPLTAMVLDANACVRWLNMPPATGLTEARSAARRIVSSGEYAGQVLARIRGFLQREPVPRHKVDLLLVAWDSLQLVAAQARRHRIALRLRPSPGLPVVHADRTQIQQVVLNLLVNAIEALQESPGDSPRCIHLSLSLPPAAPAGVPCVRVCVADNGPGIAPQQHERLFEAFQTAKPHGLGFGLSVARSIIEAHGGRIGAENLAGVGGARFWFELPFDASAP